MIIFFKNLFFRRGTKKEMRDDFSDFFINTSSKDRAKVIREVLRDANTEQRELVEESRRKSSSQLDASPY